MNILAIDTSTEACSAAFLRNDGQVFSEFEVAPRQHTRLLPKMMNSVLSAAQCPKSSINYCTFSNGPGAFTGVRIAAATAQGIGIALKIPLVPISTLAVLAQVSLDRQGDNSTMVALDARMGEVYWAVYERDEEGLASLSGQEKLSKIDEVTISSQFNLGAGHGWLVGQDIWQPDASIDIKAELFPDAKSLLKLSQKAIRLKQFFAAENITINYLRNEVARKSQKV